MQIKNISPNRDGKWQGNTAVLKKKEKHLHLHLHLPRHLRITRETRLANQQPFWCFGVV
jgi:hypothetical protein